MLLERIVLNTHTELCEIELGSTTKSAKSPKHRHSAHRLAMSIPPDGPRTRMVLVIGPPLLVNQWQLSFATRTTVLQDFYEQYPHYQVVTFPNLPYLNRQVANQLLPTLTNFSRVYLHVSLLELGHHQVVDILQGVTIVMESASAIRFIGLYLEYEIGNAEHYAAIELAEVYHLGFCFHSWLHPNRRLDGDALLPNEGDNGEVMEEEDEEVEDDSDQEIFGESFSE